MWEKIELLVKGEAFFVGVPTCSGDTFHLLENQKVLLNDFLLRKLIKCIDPDGFSILNGPHEILKILLANGCPIVEPNQSLTWLNKNYFPVSYVAQTEGAKVHLGRYYYTSNLDVDDQFPKFCHWVDYPPGFMKYFADLIIQDGGKILANIRGAETTLLEKNPDDSSVFGKEETIKFMGYQFLRVA